MNFSFPILADRLVTVTAVKIPDGIDDGNVRRQLLDEFSIEIAGGLGPVKGKIWRIGLMGYSSQRTNVLLFLAALEKTLSDQGFRLPVGAATAAAIHNYRRSAQPVVVAGGRCRRICGQSRCLSNHSQRGRDERIYRRLRRAVESYRLRLPLPLLALLERHRHPPQRHYGLQIHRRRKGVVNRVLAHPAFVTFRDRAGRNLSDREASYIAAEYLRGRPRAGRRAFALRRFRCGRPPHHRETRHPLSLTFIRRTH